jgi:hypothetical protein
LIVLASEHDEVKQAIHAIEQNQAIAGRGAVKHRDMMAYAKLGVRISHIIMGIGCLLAPIAIGIPLLFSGVALERASKKAGQRALESLDVCDEYMEETSPDLEREYRVLMRINSAIERFRAEQNGIGEANSSADPASDWL